MPKTKELCEATKAAILALLEIGMNERQVVKKLKISKTVAHYTKKKQAQHGSTKLLAGRSRKCFSTHQMTVIHPFLCQESFSSAFNTIQPSLLKVKMERVGVSDQLATWTMDYLTDRPQYVKLQDCVSDVVVCSTGAPQDTVLSLFLFTLYTSDFCYSTDSCHLQKFSDDRKGNDCEYRKVIMVFVYWCEQNHLQMNTNKTKEMVIDFHRKPSYTPPLNIQATAEDLL
ncbi:ribosome-recycling factor, mitochondrial isoform X2 [Amphiprion ocellaris]|uniref:ribosome-recycling factor, mitochondrial isoform X2 n=1 Tax=Amphiprion ocellaris TaxID=80972 RepID=UPI00241108BA|nr:ribosome-recycling factor, mitochondrial isoform X2 [Amphiprion ocellaris]